VRTSHNPVIPYACGVKSYKSLGFDDNGQILYSESCLARALGHPKSAKGGEIN